MPMRARLAVPLFPGCIDPLAPGVVDREFHYERVDPAAAVKRVLTQSFVFVLRNRSGKDTVTDYTDGVEHLSVFGKGVTSFEDLEGRIKQYGNDTWIMLSNKAVLIPKSIDSSTIDETDFQFTS